MNLAALVDEHPATDRALYEAGRWHTWGEVRARAAAVGAGLVELGVRPDDRVAIVWPTSVDFVVAYLGVLAAGAVAVPLNPNSPAGELGRELGAVEPRVLLAGGTAGAVPSVPHVVLPSAAAAAPRAKAIEAKVWEEFSAPLPPQAELPLEPPSPGKSGKSGKSGSAGASGKSGQAESSPEAATDGEHLLRPVVRQESDL